MSEERQGGGFGFGAIIVAVAVGGSFVGVIGWYVMSNRGGGPGLDTSGFDVSHVDEARRPAPPPPAAAPAAAPSSGLGMVTGTQGMSVVAPGASTPTGQKSGAAAPSGSAPDGKPDLKDVARKNEKTFYDFGRRMEKKYPSLTQYGKDWVSYPDLKGLRDQYGRDRDPVKFIYGCAKSENFGKMVKKYASDPGVRAFIMDGVKEAPSDVMSAAAGAFQNDRVVKDLVGSVVKGMGLPGSLVGLLDGGASAAKAPDQKQLINEAMQSPEMQKAMQNQQTPVGLGQGQQTPDPNQNNNGFRPLGQHR